MKKTFKFLALTVLLSMAGVVSALADDIVGKTFTDNNIEYEVTDIQVTGSSVSKATVAVVDNALTASITELKIPATVTFNVKGTPAEGPEINPAKSVTFDVTEIKTFGFSNKTELAKIEIPCSVVKIGADAFHNAAGDNLQIIFGWDATATKKSALKSIGDCAFGNATATTLDFRNCPELDLSADLNDPDRVLGMPFVERQNHKNLVVKEVLLADGTKSIGKAFSGMEELTTLDLSNTQVTVLEEGALANTKLTEVILPEVKRPDVQTLRLGKKVFANSPIETLIIKAPIAADDAVDPYAFKEMPVLKTLKFEGDITLEGAIPANAFEYTDNGEIKKSPIETLEFAGLGKGAISPKAFENQSTIQTLNFNGAIAGGAIGEEAFAGIGTEAAGCPEIKFYKALEGEKAIGKNAFAGASAQMVKFVGAIAKAAIDEYAFNELNSETDCYACVRFEGQLGERAIGQYAFKNAGLQYVLFAQPINQIGAIRNYAFEGATILGSNASNWAILFQNDLTAQYSVGKGAFQGADIRKSIVFNGNVGSETAPAITSDAFAGFTNGTEDVDGVPVIFKKSINKAGAIGPRAFKGAAISTLTINGMISGKNAIQEEAFADLKYVTEINLGSEIWCDNQNPAIAANAFANSGAIDADHNLLTVLKVGDLKSTAAIAAGAFSNAAIDIVNFGKLQAVKAIADNQFSAVDGDRGIKAATINTVNFNQDFKLWPEANNNASNNFVGNNAFSKTLVKTVNFNGAVKVADAIVADEPENGPFAEELEAPVKEGLTVNFNEDIVRGGIGANAFANSKLVTINLADKKFETLAFAAGSFMSANGPTDNKFNVTINYNPASYTTAYRSFDQQAFYGEKTYVDIDFKTMREIVDLYAKSSEDLTPFRMKFIATKYIDLVWSDAEGKYVGVFTPENEMYSIDKYQQGGNGKIGVWSAYFDGPTLEPIVDDAAGLDADGNPIYKHFSSWPEKYQYMADTYINPLRVQDGGIFVLNPGHTLIVTSATLDRIEAMQDFDHKWGGVQTFAGLSPWSCNDLRWNPAQFAESPLWEGGKIAWTAVKHGDNDFYGNTLKDYEIFRQVDFANGLGFQNAISIPAAWMYMLVTNDRAKRFKYSEYENNKNWFTGKDIPWERNLWEWIKDSNLEAVINELDLEEGDPVPETFEDAIEALAVKAGKELEPAIRNYVEAAEALKQANGRMIEADEEGKEYGYWTVEILDDQDAHVGYVSNENVNIDEKLPSKYDDYTDAEMHATSLNAASSPYRYRAVFYKPMADEDFVTSYGKWYAVDRTIGTDMDEENYGGRISEYELYLLTQQAKANIMEEVDDTDDMYKRYQGYLTRDLEKLPAGAINWYNENYDTSYPNQPHYWDNVDLTAAGEAQDAYQTAKSNWDNVQTAWDAIKDRPQGVKWVTSNPEDREKTYSQLSTGTSKTAIKNLFDALKTATGDTESTYDELVFSVDMITNGMAAAKETLVTTLLDIAPVEEWAWIGYTYQMLGRQADWSPEQIAKLDDYNTTYNTVARNRERKFAVATLKDYIDELQATEWYIRFNGYRDAIGAPVAAVTEGEGDDKVTLIEAKDATENGLTAKFEKAADDLVDAIAKEGAAGDAGARLNIIWNDGSENQVVGIMEAVVNGTAMKGGDNVIYNLNGMRVKNTGKGIYIQNGKKVIK